MGLGREDGLQHVLYIDRPPLDLLQVLIFSLFLPSILVCFVVLVFWFFFFRRGPCAFEMRVEVVVEAEVWVERCCAVTVDLHSTDRAGFSRSRSLLSKDESSIPRDPSSVSLSWSIVIGGRQVVTITRRS